VCIRCTFGVTSLDEPQDFEALSYAWGDPHAVIPIVLNDKKVLVTKNLHCALWNLRRDNEERAIWIDTLSINQSDDDERASQVAQMREVYSLASTVLVFLGETWEGCDAAMDLVEVMGTDTSIYLKTSMQKHVTVRGMHWDSETLRASLANFLSLPWFFRTWTVQEYVLAQLVVIQCGRRLMDGDHMRGFVDTLTVHMPSCCTPSADVWLKEFPNAPPLGTVIGNLFNLERVHQARETWDLLRLAMVFRSRKSYDPRDKIYGMLGLTESGLVEVDYGLSTDKVFTNLMMGFIEQTQTLDVLSYGYGVRHLSLDLPSFVPDWTASTSSKESSAIHEQSAIQDRTVLSRSNIYNACRGTPQQFVLHAHDTAASKGLIIDTVAALAHNQGLAGWDDLFGHPLAPEAVDDRKTSPQRTAITWQTLCGGAIFVRDQSAEGH
jgi:hypothetical protein